MGYEARFQAMPEDCELMLTARHDRAIAECMQFFKTYTSYTTIVGPTIDPKHVEFLRLVKKTIALKPDIVQRYFYGGARTFDAIVYLLSPIHRQSRTMMNLEDDSQIYRAIWGMERLHPEAVASQGFPIGFVSAHAVSDLSDYLDGITHEMLHVHYDVRAMYEAGVYKMGPYSDEERFNAIWDEFVGMRKVYRAAAQHGEAMITVID
jgi:hypothetical protein